MDRTQTKPMLGKLVTDCYDSQGFACSVTYSYIVLCTVNVRHVWDDQSCMFNSIVISRPEQAGSINYKRIWWAYHSIGGLIDGAHPGPKTDKDYLGSYCPYIDLWNGKGKARKVVPLGIEPRDSGLSCQCSTTKLRHPPTTTSLPLTYITQFWDDCCRYVGDNCCVCSWLRKNLMSLSRQRERKKSDSFVITSQRQNRKHTSVYWQVNLSMQIQDMIDVVNDDRLCDGWNTTALDSHQLTDAANGLYTVAGWYWLLAPTAHYPNVCWCFLYVFNNITHAWQSLRLIWCLLRPIT